MGMSPKEIADTYDLTRSEVHAALAYYWDHREALDRKRAHDDAYAEEMRRRNPGPLEEKLKLRQRG